MAEVLVVGDSHLATVTIAGLLELGYTVYSRLDDSDTPDDSAVAQLFRGERAAGEPEVADILATGLTRGVLRQANRQPAAESAGSELTVVAYDSCTATNGTMVDLRPTATATTMLAAPGRVGPVILMSQVRAGTGDAVLAAAGLTGDSPDLVHIPENLRLGRSFQDFLRPHRLVIGCNGHPPAAVGRLVDLLQPVQLRTMTLVEAELVKHATNAYLAACITLANDVGIIAGHLGADPATVMDGVRADPRVAETAPMRPGAPYAGATLQRDVRALWEHGEPIGRDGLFRAISNANSAHALSLLAVLDRRLDGLAGRRICLLGLTYKPGVSTLRDSPGLRLADALIAHGTQVAAFDPVAEEFVPTEVQRHADMHAAADGADCVVLVVEHDAFTVPNALESLRPARNLLLRLTGSARQSKVATPAGWISVDPWRG